MAAPEPTKPCLQCGHGLRPNAQFCQRCGHPTRAISPQRYATGKLPTQSVLTGGDGETYLIVELVAQGGMGAIYKAVRPSDQSVWAVKEMSESVIASEDWEKSKAAFYAEAHLLQTLQYKHLPKVIDVFESNQRHYMVMDFIEGHTLTQVLAQEGGTLTEEKVVEFGKQLCLALHYLHTHNPPIIYRDMKPDNVMVEAKTNCVKLIDFGIARRFKSGKKSDTVHLGTNGYAAPEQYGKEGQQSDAVTDIYALGATLHQLLTGLDPAQSPFHFPDVHSHATVSLEVGEAIAKAIKLRPWLRHQSAAEMYEALTGEAFPEIEEMAALSPTMPQMVTQTSGTAVSAPILQINSLEAKAVLKGTQKTFSLPISVQSGVWDVSASVEWLTLSTEIADSQTKVIEITADTSLLPLEWRKRSLSIQPDTSFGKMGWPLLWLIYAHTYYLVPHAATHRATIQVGPEMAAIQIEVVPSNDRVMFGWALSGLAVAAEIMGVGWLLWVLFAGL
jgi:serine/threonine protein kinase